MNLNASTIVTILILLTTVATIGLIYYARVVVPRRMEARIRQSVRAFAMAIELRIPSHQGLADRVMQLCLLVGKDMQLSRRKLHTLELVAQLRDIGMCAIPYRLVNHKSPYSWDDADWATYFRHAEVGAAMLELVPWLRYLAPIVRTHHLDYAGSEDVPFPAKDDIPVEARILKVVGDFVWHSRLQGAILARDTIRRESGTKYDPAVVDALVNVLTSVRGESTTTLVQAT